MKQIIISLIFSCLATLSIGQNRFVSPTYIYKITNIEAEKILTTREKPKNFFDNYFYNLVDSNQLGDIYVNGEDFEIGYYLKVQISGENLNINLISVHSIDVHKIEDDGYFHFQVVDSLAQPLVNAKVTVNGRRVRIDKATKSYKVETLRFNGLMKIQANDQVLLYDFRRENYLTYGDNFWERSGTFFGHQWDRISRPFRYPRARTGIENLIEQIDEKRWSDEWVSRFKQKRVNGYLLINQPTYNHNDTLGAKAYITTRRGRPINTEVEVAIYRTSYYSIHNSYNDEAPVYSTTIQPKGKGNYEFEFVIPDSLTLDETYTITFCKKTNGLHKRIYHYQIFELEDFRLKDGIEKTKEEKIKYETQIHYSVKKQSEKDSLVFILAAQDDNDEYLSFPRANLIIHRGIVDHYEDNEIYIANELWSQSVSLNSNAPAIIKVPRDKLPNYSGTIDVTVKFYTDLGTSQTVIEEFNYNAEYSELHASIENGYIIAYILEGKDTIRTNCQLYLTKNSRPLEEISKTVQLPYKERIQPLAIDYIFEKEGVSVFIFPNEESDEVEWTGKNTGDSLLIQLENPRQLPVIYAIYKADRLIEKGETTEKQWTFLKKYAGYANYSLEYIYPWAGEYIQDEIDFHYLKKELNITIDQPETITPGSEIPVTIKVENHKGKPAKKVNLTATSIHKDFAAVAPSYRKPYKLPYLSIGRRKSNDSNFNDYEIKNMHSQQYHAPYNKDWLDRMELLDNPFYQIRNPKNGISMKYQSCESDTFYAKIAQFSPYIAKEGQLQTIQLIYINNRLVYYANAARTRPYAFIGLEGLNTIEIRTKDKLYTIENIELKKGFKLNLAIDELEYTSNGFSKNIKVKSMPSFFTKEEVALLKSSFFTFLDNNRSDQYLWEDSSEIHFIPDLMRNRLIGPFRNNATLHLIREGEFEKDIQLEKNKIYGIDINNTKIYENTIFDKPIYLSNQSSSANSRKHPIGELIHKPSMINATNYVISDFKEYFRGFNFYKTQLPADRTSYIVDYPKSAKQIIAIAWFKADSLLAITQTSTRFGIQPGKYKAVFFFADETFYEHTLMIKSDTIFYQKINFPDDLSKDTNFELLKSYMYTFQKPIKYKSKPITTENQQRYSYQNLNPHNSYMVSGRIIDAETEEGLISASVLVEGTATGTVTDAQGYFTITLPNDKDKLIFSYAGYKTQHINLFDYQGALTIKMTYGANLDNAVVAALGIAHKSDYQRIGFHTSSLKEKENAQNLELVDVPVKNNLEGYQLRKNFRDRAYWKPTLITDKNGEVHFKTVVPDNITVWNTTVIGMDKKQRSGISKTQSLAYKQLQAELYVPRFLIEGDSIEIAGTATNYTKDSFQIKTTFKQDNQTIKTQFTQLTGKATEYTTIIAQTDTTKLSYELNTGKYGDGELRDIPIFKKGVDENVGYFMLLESDTTFQLDFDKYDSDVHVTIKNNLLDVLLEDIEGLKHYPYGCNEQTASRLFALLMEEKIKKQIRTPVYNQESIHKMINRLTEKQNTDGSYGWWKDGRPINWITI